MHNEDIHEIPCFDCDGTYTTKFIDYETDVNGKPLIVKNVPVMFCNKCDDQVLDHIAINMIEHERELAGAKYRPGRRSKS